MFLIASSYAFHTYRTFVNIADLPGLYIEWRERLVWTALKRNGWLKRKEVCPVFAEDNIFSGFLENS